MQLVAQVDRTKINGLEFKTTFIAALSKEETITPEGRQILRTVDATGRVIEEKLGNLTPIEYLYDNEGLLQQIKQGSRIWDLGYDASGHISSLTNPLLEMTHFATDAIGRLTSETNPLSQTTAMSYDDNGNAESVTPAGKPLHGMTYTSLDQLTTYTAPVVNGQPSQTTWSYDFDEDLDLVTLPDQSIVDYTPDNAGRPQTITLPGSEGTITLGYHPTRGQIESVTGPQSINLTLGYNGRLLTDQTFSDMTTSTTVHHDHDTFFRVTNETVNGLFPAAFHYDADGLLHSVYADGLRLVAELNGAGQIVARFIYGRHINVPDIMIKNGTAYRIITDHLGSPRFVVNVQTGAIAQAMSVARYQQLHYTSR